MNTKLIFLDRSITPLVIIFFVQLLISILAAQTGDVRHVHDPCIIKCDDYYYIFSTGDRIAMRRSSDLQSWQFIGEVFQDIPAWGKKEVPGVSNIWAPDIYFHNGIYYLYYSLSTFGSNRSRIGLATNKTLDPANPDYEWIDRGKVYESNTNDNFNAIDPNIFLEQNNRLWMSFGSFWSGIKIVELETTTWKPPQNARLRTIASRGGDAIEAPFIIYKNGYYYLFVSFDFCCRGVNSTYKIMVGRSEKITGPFVDRNRRNMLNGGGHLLMAGDARWRGTGHCAVLMEEDADWLVYHAYDANANGTPTLRIARLYWDNDGWPTTEKPAPVMNRIDHQPNRFALHQNYPNPFNPETTISYEISESGLVQLSIFDLRGQKIKALVDNYQLAGHYTVTWNPVDISSGLYIYKLTFGDFSNTKKILFQK